MILAACQKASDRIVNFKFEPQKVNDEPQKVNGSISILPQYPRVGIAIRTKPAFAGCKYLSLRRQALFV
jgi:hypothetical protein